ncbi:MAG: DNA-binding protein [Desulfovibrio sp.]
MKDISYNDHMTEWLRGPAHAVEYLNAAIEDGDCPTLALALERVVKARPLQSADLPAEGLEALCRLKPFLDSLGMHLTVTAR